MSRPLRRPTEHWDDEALLTSALVCLRNARDNLAIIGANKAADKVRRALKSAEGAARHLSRVLDAADARRPEDHSIGRIIRAEREARR